MKMQIVDVDYFLNTNKPVVRIFGRSQNGNAVCILYDQLLPYFYVKCSEEQAERIKGIKEVRSVEDAEMYIPIGYQEKKTLLKKIILLNPQDVPETRDRISALGIREVFEADIMFKYRFMIDHGLFGMQWIDAECTKANTKVAKVPAYCATTIKPVEQTGNAELRILSFDIECVSDDIKRAPDAKKDPIVMISMAFHPAYKGKKNIVFVAKHVLGENTKGFGSEKNMLEEFVKLIDDYDPDIITGYNINNFDLPYLMERLKHNKIPLNIGRSDKPMFGRTTGMTTEFVIPGRVVFDPYQILKRDPWLKFQRYDLNTVAKKMLNEEKHNVEYSEMAALWAGSREGLSRFIEYARKDADLSLRLVVEKGLMDKFYELSKISGVLLQDVFGGQTRRVDTMILHEFKKMDFVMPLNPSKSDLIRRAKERDKEGLKGAIVMEPKKGLHADGCVIVLDFKSLYPSIMRTYNISPDTLLQQGNAPHETSPTGAKFVAAGIQQGILPSLLTQLIETRSKIKKEMKAASGEKKRILNAKQLAIKDMSNSVHASTDIVVQEPTGNLHVCEIETLFNELVKEHPVKKIGDTEVIELDRWQTLSVDGNKSCFKPMYAISRHKHAGELTRIKTAMSEVMITDDHSIMAMAGRQSNRQRESQFDGLVEKGGKEVSEEDIIAQVRKVCLPENDVTFNWLEFLKTLPEEEILDICLYIPKSLQLNKKGWLKNRVKMLSAFNGPADSATLQTIVERRILRSSEGVLINRTGLTTVGNCGIVPVYEPTEDGEALIDFYEDFTYAKEEPLYYTLPITAAQKLPKFIERHSFVAVGGAHQGRRKVPIHLPVTDELAELIGWFVAEGSTYKRGNSFRSTISNTNKSHIRRITYLIKKCFGYDARIFNKDITMNTKLLYLFFRHLCGSSSYMKQVPDFILNSNTKIREAFMKGYYSGDGNVKVHRINTVSKTLAAQLNVMLKEFGGVQYNYFDGLYRISRRQTSHGNKIVSGDLFGQRPKISRCASSEYVYDLSVRDTEMFVTAQGTVLHNSFYGYCGYTRARLYNIDVAASITAYGRENLQKTKKLIEENFDVEVIYADTDSAFLKTKTINLDEAKKIGEGIARFVTDNLPGYLELQFEKIYRTFIILTKKRYAGLKYELAGDTWTNEIEMRGIETVRRDWCPLVSQVMLDVLDILLKEGDLQKAIDVVKDVLEKLRHNQIDLDRLTIIKGITKHVDSYEGLLPHIELARKMTMRNPQAAPRIGDRIGFVIIRGNQLLSKRAEDPEYVKKNNIEIDSDYYIHNQLLPPLERIFTSVGVEKSEILGSGRQVSLGDVMNGTKRKMKHDIDVRYDHADSTDKKEQPLQGWEAFVCKKCAKSFRSIPLQGSCECGGEILMSYHGSVSNRAVINQ
ncbi:MAG: hypothetical protein HY514_02900 [Candidatus Aenigmarchaeota archaeon]|nr:hypothetical protein [Candidatus Aenigmarchaeota archaeon]